MNIINKLKKTYIYRICIYYSRKYAPKSLRPKILVNTWKKVCGDGEGYDFANPRTYTQKIQWLKLYDSTPIKSQLTDKVAVREWIKDKIGEEYLIPVIGVYDHFEDIDFKSLPNQFVIKLNHGSGWNIVVKDKTKLDVNDAKKRIKKWMKLDFSFWSVYEMHYSPIKPRILIEKYVEDSKGKLSDYKFLAFDGIVKYCWMDFDRAERHKRNVYDLEWNLQPWNQYTYGNYEGTVDKPKNFEEMCRIATILSEGFNHVRIDLYNVDGKIYFGEMTFTNGSGLEKITPKEYDSMLGNMLTLPEKR